MQINIRMTDEYYDSDDDDSCFRLLPGDGIGPEVTEAAVSVLSAVASQFSHHFRFEEQLLGGCAIDETGVALPQETLDSCLKADAVLLGAVGGGADELAGAPILVVFLP